MGGLSADVKRHLARVYAILAASILASAGSCAAVVLLVPLVPPFDVVVFGLGFVGLLVGIIAFACTPRERFHVRYALLMANCVFGGFLLAFIARAEIAEDPSSITATLVITAMIFMSVSAAAILSPQSKAAMYMIALALMITTLIVLSYVLAIVNIVFYSSAHDAVYAFLMLVVFCLFIAWETEVIIEKASRGECDPVGDAAALFNDLINVFLRVAACIAGDSTSRDRENEPLLTEGSVA